MSQSGATPSLPVSRDLLRLIAGRLARLGAHRGMRARAAPDRGAPSWCSTSCDGTTWVSFAVPRAHPDGGLLGIHRRPPARPRERGGEPAVRAPLLRRAGAAAALFARAGTSLVAVAASTLVAGVLASRLHDRVRQAEVARALPRGRRGAVAAVLVRRAGVADPELRAAVRRDLPRPLQAARAHAGGLVRHPRGRARMARSGSSPAPIATPRASSSSGRSRNTARGRCRSPPRRWRLRWSK